MSAPHIILDNLPSLCKNCQIWWKFDIVITKIILLVFFETRCSKYCSNSLVSNLAKCLLQIPGSNPGP